MELVNDIELTVFSKKHSNSRKPLVVWIKLAKAADWQNFADVRQTFRSADYVKGHTIFDLCGNNFRIITFIDYFSKRIYIIEVLTHSDYDRWKA